MGNTSSSHTSTWNIVMNVDILSLIFDMNADIFVDHDALTTTRLSSQVCRTWRSTILNSTSLWGRLIDIDSLDQQGEEWRNEVLRRTGSASLIIKASKSLQLPGYLLRCSHCKTSMRWKKGLNPWQLFFFSVLENHWRRIERLSVNVGSHIMHMFEPWPWQIMCTPAPRLRVFEFYSKCSASLSHFEDKPIFDNDAPLLCEFHATDIPVDWTSAWFRNLRSVRLGPLKASTHFQFLFAISSITDLYIKEDTVLNELCRVQERTSKILFPTLRAIHLNGLSKELLAFLHMRHNLGLSIPILSLRKLDQRKLSGLHESFAGIQIKISHQLGVNDILEHEKYPIFHPLCGFISGVAPLTGVLFGICSNDLFSATLVGVACGVLFCLLGLAVHCPDMAIFFMMMLQLSLFLMFAFAEEYHDPPIYVVPGTFIINYIFSSITLALARRQGFCRRDYTFSSVSLHRLMEIILCIILIMTMVGTLGERIIKFLSRHSKLILNNQCLSPAWSPEERTFYEAVNYRVGTILPYLARFNSCFNELLPDEYLRHIIQI